MDGLMEPSSGCNHNILPYGPDWRGQLKFWFTAGLQTTPLCSGWGSNQILNGSQIPSHHMPGVWQPSFAVDEYMELSSLSYHPM